jgi:hypothetical protein
MANNQARKYSILTIKRLYALSRNSCAFPGCGVTFLNAKDDTNFSNICHIEDANENLHKSDRYNSKMTDDQRRDFKNLILLCPNHHIETNNTDTYTVEALREMKKNHETKTVQSWSGQDLIGKHPSALNTVIGHIGIDLFDQAIPDDPMTAPDPANKIEFNKVVRYKPIIEEYKIYQGKLSKIYDEIERLGSTKKELVLRNIKNLYLKEKGKYGSIDELKDNADAIIANVESELWNIIDQSQNQNSNLPIEAIEISLLVILVDAFMRCSILEEPSIE